MDDRSSFLHPFSTLEVQAAQKVMFIIRMAPPRIRAAVMLTLDEYFEKVTDLAHPHLKNNKGNPFLHVVTSIVWWNVAG